MIKIVIFSGGTGSAALQKGVSTIYGMDNIQLDIIVNAYDNGKSTGACRRIFDNRILGPSDVRKNQLLQFSFQHQKEMADTRSRYFRLYQLFDARLSAPDPLSYYNKSHNILESYGDIFDFGTWNYLQNLMDYFFFGENIDNKPKLRRNVQDEIFEDFSLSNIFYAASAAMNEFSLEAAADRMADILEIKRNVHLISNKNLILQAETESGGIIADEGDIVSWSNPDDKIIRAILLDGNTEYTPSINEDSSNTEHSIERIVADADIIIFSSGTQWSSLIPTYMHQGFSELINQSMAKKYLIMNNTEDHDALGVDAAEWCTVLERYLDLSKITIVSNEYASPSMTLVPKKYRSIRGRLSKLGDQKHIPEQLTKVIMSDYYAKALLCRCQLFDLDGTLWNEGGTKLEQQVGEENLQLFQGMIVSGNNKGHIVRVLKCHAPMGKKIEIFADYGNSHFTINEPDKITYLTDKYFLDKTILERIESLDEFAGKAVLRGGTVITIKPLKDRERLVGLLNQKLNSCNKNIAGKKAGKTSIDVTYADYTKAAMIELILEKYNIIYSDVLFIGNELDHGNDKEVASLEIATLQVDDVFECNTYLKTRQLVEFYDSHS